MPDSLRELVREGQIPREVDKTPNSIDRKAARDLNKAWLEDTEAQVLVDKLLYQPQWTELDDDNGEPLVSRLGSAVSGQCSQTRRWCRGSRPGVIAKGDGEARIPSSAGTRLQFQVQ